MSDNLAEILKQARAVAAEAAVVYESRMILFGPAAAIVIAGENLKMARVHNDTGDRVPICASGSGSPVPRDNAGMVEA